MDRVSVPSLGNKFSLPLPVIALVGHYPANKLIGRRLLPKQLSAKSKQPLPPKGDHPVLSRISPSYSGLQGRFLRVTNSFAVGLNPLDLHALSTPPAFILSQDQTLNKKIQSNLPEGRKKFNLVGSITATE